ncbi:hypothetical protein HDU98_004325 [Podochytrium sp. JEL0797]|nr:hypothetical protein HDU98_004325 [Podochytrium sp. JEL0797]
MKFLGNKDFLLTVSLDGIKYYCPVRGCGTRSGQYPKKFRVHDVKTHIQKCHEKEDGFETKWDASGGLTDAGRDQYGAMMQVLLEGRKNESQELLKAAYLTFAAEHRRSNIPDFLYFYSLQVLVGYADPSNEDFLKNIQRDSNAPTHHRALVAFGRGSLIDLSGNCDEASSLYRKTISLCDKVTPSELEEAIACGDDGELASLREYLKMPTSFLTAAKVSLDRNSNTQHYYTKEEADGIKATMRSFGQVSSPVPRNSVKTGPSISETRKNVEFPRLENLLSNRFLRHECDECCVLSRNKEPVVRLKRCGECLSKLYCSPECQHTAWKAGHKAMCRRPTSLVEFDLVRVHGLKNAKYSSMNGSIFEIRGSALTSSGDNDLEWIVSYLGGGNEVVVKHMNLTRVMFKEERWNWEALETEFSK